MITNSSNEEISKKRDEIRNLDDQIISVLAQRRQICREIGDLKEEDGSQLRDQEREEVVLSRVIQKGKELGIDSLLTTQIFHSIIGDSIRCQEHSLLNRKKYLQSVVLLGGKGSYSYKAVSRLLGGEDSFRAIPENSFYSVLNLCEQGLADSALLPIENSITGSIQEVYDLLSKTQLKIIGEELLPIDHALMSQPQTTLENLEIIYGHRQALAQCSAKLLKLKGIHIEWVSHTTEAIERVEKSSQNCAALASAEEASLRNLKILDGAMANRADNQTRFILLAPDLIPIPKSIPCKVSLLLSTPQKVGALAEVLLIFRSKNINLTRLESRPLGVKNWEQVFFIDFEGNLAEEPVNSAIEDLHRLCRYIRVLGCYPNSERPATQVPFLSMLQEQSTSTSLTDTKTSTMTTTPPNTTATATETVSATKKKGKTGLLASRERKQEDTIIKIGNVSLGGDHFVVIGGPCAVESQEQIETTAAFVKEQGAHMLRGGCFKPRTSPYSFQGLGFEGLDLLKAAGDRHHLPIVTEVMKIEDLAGVAEKADVIQIGARNMQNFSLLKAVGLIHRPVMLKRGLMASIDELLQAAEYIMSQGNQEVFLCERGIRTFETATRNTLDLSAIPVIKERSHLPIIVDPSHAGGQRSLVIPLALAAKAVGSHGIMVETHPKPEEALSDGPQALYLPQFADLMRQLYRPT